MKIKCPYTDCNAPIEVVNVKNKDENRICLVCKRAFNVFQVLSSEDQKLFDITDTEIPEIEDRIGTLFVKSEDGIQEYVIVNQETIVGRKTKFEREGIEIPTRDLTMSRRHFKLIFKDNQMFIQSLQPKNGTFIQELNIEEERKKSLLKNKSEMLLNNDMIIISGRTKMYVSLIKNRKKLYQLKEKLGLEGFKY